MTGQKVIIGSKENHADPNAKSLLSTIRNYFFPKVEDLRILRGYHIKKDLSEEQIGQITENLFVDPIFEAQTTFEACKDYNWWVEVSFKEGVTDNSGAIAKITIEDFLGIPFEANETVRSSRITLIKGELTLAQVRRIAEELLANSLIETIEIRNRCHIEAVDVDVSDDELLAISQKRHLALSLQEMKAIKNYYAQDVVKKKRESLGLPLGPTDVELEALAQTWSEHCKHKIFQALIRYTEEGKTTVINSLFQTYIKKATEDVKEHCPWLVSVFTDNAGIIRFTDEMNLAFKVETHNSPSALDPYGGALTGILGVNRDIMGAGIGAKLIANTNILCFAPPDYNKPLPKRLMPPKRIFEGVRLGIEHGGNKSGVPTVNGAIVFDECYVGKPLVYCGSVGIMPAEIDGRPTHIKKIEPGDLVVIAGGRTGKDGLHGATFSSEALHDESPSGAVQIGDPFTQKKLHDFLLEARNSGYIRTLTDNGAGGFSSSVGELAELSGGCEIHLDQAPLKQQDLKPWEILLSESQERMTLAIDPSFLDPLSKLAEIHEIEIAVLGTFTDSGAFHVLYNKKTVAYLPLSFLHGGLPQMELEAHWTPPQKERLELPPLDIKDTLHKLLMRYNIASKEFVIRQYDHEVQGTSVLKPLTGINDDGPSDAAVIRPLKGKNGVVLANGICPRYSSFDTYYMAANAVDEAVRNCVAVGGDPKTIAILDNFCWPDPVYDEEKTPDGKLKLAQLVRAAKALYDVCTAMKIPLISGKDSMKNDANFGGMKISIKPTLLISAVCKIHDIEKTVSMDVKFPGDLLFLIGGTKNELGASELALMLGLKGGEVPKINPEEALKNYVSLHQAIEEELIASCHDCSEGGLAVALAEMAFAGGLGMTILLPQGDAEYLFSESGGRLIVAVAPENADRFLEICKAVPLGVVESTPDFRIYRSDGSIILEEKIELLKASWRRSCLL